MENYTKAEEYVSRSGVTEILTVTVETNSGEVTTDAGTVQTHTVVGARAADLSLISLTASANSDTLSDVLLTSLPVSYFIHNGTDTYLSGSAAAFAKDVPGTDLTFTDGVHTFAISDTVDAYTLPSGNGYASAGLLDSEVADEVQDMMARLKREVDAVQNIDLYNKLVALGFRYDA